MTKMKIALALLSIAAPLAAQSFEGSVSMNISPDNGSQPQQLTFMLKGGKMRFDPPGAPVSVIIDPAAQRMMVIMSSQRMYMERDFGSAVASIQQQVGGKSPTIVHTKKMDMIAGYKCEHLTITDDDGGIVDACASTELGGFRMPAASNPMAPQREAGWLTQLGAANFPLKVVKGGKTLLEVTAIKKESLDPSLFAAPEGFQSFAMPATKRPPQR
jgi:hypothetical protein